MNILSRHSGKMRCLDVGYKGKASFVVITPQAVFLHSIIWKGLHCTHRQHTPVESSWRPVFFGAARYNDDDADQPSHHNLIVNLV